MIIIPANDASHLICSDPLVISRPALSPTAPTAPTDRAVGGRADGRRTNHFIDLSLGFQHNLRIQSILLIELLL
jgi:hypothetical protein